MAEKKVKKEKKDNFIKKTIQGRIVSGDFFYKNIFTTTAIVIMFIIYMAGKFQGRTQREEIISLTRELNDAKSDCIKYSSEYNSMTRESDMRELIKNAGINLESPDKPAYIIK
ncbi:MAG: FtsL-like putative cell division protein [Bacteroidales bacterium]